MTNESVNYRNILTLIDQMDRAQEQLEIAEKRLFGRALKDCKILIPGKRDENGDIIPIHEMYNEIIEKLRPESFVIDEYVPEFDKDGRRVMWVIPKTEFLDFRNFDYGEFLHPNSTRDFSTGYAESKMLSHRREVGMDTKKPDSP